MLRPDSLHTAPRRPVRRRRGSVEAATVGFAHPGTGHRIVVVGVLHLGTQAYWDRLGADLAAAEQAGWAIHTEGVSGPTRQERLAATPQTLEHWDNLTDLVQMTRKVGEATGLVHQGDGLTLPGSATRVDLTLPQVAERLDPAQVERAARRLDGVDLTLSADLPERAYRITSRTFANALTLALSLPSGLWGLLGLGRGLDRRVVLDTRNLYAVSAAVAVQEQPVLLLWGAGHLPGMARLLHEHGYRPSVHQWRPALHASDIALRRAEPEAETETEQERALDPTPWVRGRFRASRPSVSAAWRFDPRPPYSQDRSHYDDETDPPEKRRTS